MLRPTSLGGVRVAADVLRTALVVGATAYLLTGQPGPGLLCLSAAVPSIVARTSTPLTDLGFGVGLATFVWPSNTGLLDGVPHTDDVAHFLLPFLVTHVLWEAAGRAGVVAPAAGSAIGLAATALTAGALALSLGAAWELCEWSFDGLFGTNFSLGYTDTEFDLLFDACGALLGGITVAARARMATARRLRC